MIQNTKHWLVLKNSLTDGVQETLDQFLISGRAASSYYWRRCSIS
ncbi:MAG: hypothetical protein V1792_02865 [Pseudomonadota bacterium]